MSSTVSALRPESGQLSERARKILAGVNLSGKRLEVGGGYSPIVTRAEGYDVEFLDYTDKQSLIAKLGTHGWDTSRIQPVDYIWSGERYFDLVNGKQFNWILASHVIEHVTKSDRVHQRMLGDLEYNWNFVARNSR
jgi:2-polyprenyl-3-methyl-5-hydroxy-6-metoxy-1,4-benzoquinol methylase